MICTSIYINHEKPFIKWLEDRHPACRKPCRKDNPCFLHGIGELTCKVFVNGVRVYIDEFHPVGHAEGIFREPQPCYTRLRLEERKHLNPRAAVSDHAGFKLKNLPVFLDGLLVKGPAVDSHWQLAPEVHVLVVDKRDQGLKGHPVVIIAAFVLCYELVTFTHHLAEHEFFYHRAEKELCLSHLLLGYLVVEKGQIHAHHHDCQYNQRISS